MYFVWRSDAELADDFMYVSKVAVGLKPAVWTTGQPVVTPPETVTLVGDTDSPTTMSDMILTRFGLPVLSPKAIAVLEELGVDNVQYFPINLKNHETGAVETSYKIANVIGLINCLDKKHATFNTLAEDENHIIWLQEYRVFENKIVPIGKSKKPPLLFRLGEFKSHVLAHESVKKAFEKRGITGATFTPTEKVA